MAKIIQAFTEFGPEIDLGPLIEMPQLAEFIEMRTGMNKSEITGCLMELSAAGLFFTKKGQAVKFPGIGIVTPTIDRTGKFNVGFRADSELRNGLNTPGAFTGDIKNSANIGLDDAGYKALWDAVHPADPLDIGTVTPP